MKYTPNAMKFGNQSRSSSLIINMIFEIADRDPKLKTLADLVSKLIMIVTQIYKFAKFGPKTEMCSNFYETFALEQMEHNNYEYSTWN